MENFDKFINEVNIKEDDLKFVMFEKEWTIKNDYKVVIEYSKFFSKKENDLTEIELVLHLISVAVGDDLLMLLKEHKTPLDIVSKLGEKILKIIYPSYKKSILEDKKKISERLKK